MRLLDTNILSEIIRAALNPRVVARLRNHHSGNIFASAVSRYELRCGAAIRDDADRFWSRIQREILPVVTWLPITQDIADRSRIISAHLHRKGRMCGVFDPLLAATAHVHNLIVVTRNVLHFEPVSDLVIENWFAEVWQTVGDKAGRNRVNSKLSP